MSQQVRAAALLRRAAEMLDVNVTPVPTVTTTCTPSSIATTTTTTNVAQIARGLFGPYRNSTRPFQRASRRGGRVEPAVSYWTHKFSVVPRCKQETVPNREEKFKLHSAGLGEKRLSFIKNSNKIDFDRTLEEAFPKLKDCGGYELMRTPPGSRITLESIMMPTGGFTSAFLADESNLGQAICYIRPIQKDLDMGILNTEPSEPCQECLTCGDMVPINLLRDHVEGCQFTDDTVPPEKMRKTTVQIPVCQFTCTSTSSRHEDCQIDQSKQKEYGVCPVCQKSFEMDILETHAAGCGVDMDTHAAGCSKTQTTACEDDSLLSKREDISFETAVKDKFLEMELEETWSINVVRRLFYETAIDELTNSHPTDWEKKINVIFIGEKGIDGGGLTREFFSLLFEKTRVFEEDGFSYNADLLEKKEYLLMGKATAIAILHGHPGPCRLNKLLVEYILKGVEPEPGIPESYIRNAEVKVAIKEISAATEENIAEVFDRHSHLLDATGYTKRLSVNNRDGAIDTMKFYYSFYRYIAPMLQFMEGLKLHDMLSLLRKHWEKGQEVLGCDNKLTSALEVQNFYVPNFSESAHHKETEEMIVFNFGKFLKKVERESISTNWVNVEDSEYSERAVTLNMGHVLQALIGCGTLPKNITSGEMDFCHSSDQFSFVNTCAPSIAFCRTQDLVNYEKLEDHLIRIIVEAEGFGLA